MNSTEIVFQQSLMMKHLRHMLVLQKKHQDELNDAGIKFINHSIRERVVSLQALGYLHHAKELCEAFGHKVEVGPSNWIEQ